MRYGTQRILPQNAAGNLRWLPTRYGNPIVAVVIHRMLGYLYGTDDWFRNYAASGTTSTHFGIGSASFADMVDGRSSIFQWVDTAHTAFGWNARPSDTPTPLARTVFGKWLTDPSMDMNRVVISIEVEGFYDDPWHPGDVENMRRLLSAIRAAHGPLWVVAHSDLSPKLCPGMETFNDALPGLYGSRLGSGYPSGGSTSLPDTAVPGTDIERVGGLPMPFVNEAGKAISIRAFKPLRDGASLTARTLAQTKERTTLRLWFSADGQSVGGSTKWYGGALWIKSQGRPRVVYTPEIDTLNYRKL